VKEVKEEKAVTIKNEELITKKMSRPLSPQTGTHLVACSAGTKYCLSHCMHFVCERHSFQAQLCNWSCGEFILCSERRQLWVVEGDRPWFFGSFVSRQKNYQEKSSNRVSDATLLKKDWYFFPGAGSYYKKLIYCVSILNQPIPILRWCSGLWGAWVILFPMWRTRSWRPN
jgi:hypothetical protein